jgi:hypothetical protein
MLFLKFSLKMIKIAQKFGGGETTVGSFETGATLLYSD